MPPRAAIVTLTLGDSFRWLWRRCCRPSWSAYAERHGYDLICLEAPLNASPEAAQRMPAWQKCLILSQPFAARYDQIVWVDADVLIHPQAPAITAGVPLEQVGAVDEYAAPSPDAFQLALRRLYAHYRAVGLPYTDAASPAEFYAAFDLPAGFQQVLQSGVMVLARRYHRELLEHVYHTYAPRDVRRLGEMRPLSYELLRAARVHWIDQRFNFLFSVYQALNFPHVLDQPDPAVTRQAAAEAYERSYFLHLAGYPTELANLTPPAPRHLTYGPRRSAPPAPVETPVAMFLFNRPALTAQVFAAIRAARPRRLLLIADGPRADVPSDAAQVAAARAAVSAVDWECQVDQLYADHNLGLKPRFDSGLQWVFSQVEQAIILEDDCLPGPDFFAFCQAMLRRYADDPRVLSVSGNNFQVDDPPGGASYYFSRYPHVWGWATWRRAWALHDPAMRAWPAARAAHWLDGLFAAADSRRYWDFIFQTAYDQPHTWDYPWTFTGWQQGGLHLHPAANLVSNIGFGEQATHTGALGSLLADLPIEPLPWPLRHPPAVARSVPADDYSERLMFGGTLTRAFKMAHARLQRRATLV